MFGFRVCAFAYAVVRLLSWSIADVLVILFACCVCVVVVLVCVCACLCMFPSLACFVVRLFMYVVD